MTQQSTYITLGDGRNIQDVNGAYDHGYAIVMLPSGKMLWLGNSWATAESFVAEENPSYSYGWLDAQGATRRTPGISQMA